MSKIKHFEDGPIPWRIESLNNPRFYIYRFKFCIIRKDGINAPHTGK